MSNPTSKTYYNQRVFVIYRPDDFRDYLMKVIKIAPDRQYDLDSCNLGLMAWGTILIYRARMLPFEFFRQLKMLVGGDGRFLPEYQEPSVPLSRKVLRQELAMQLGIEAAMRDPEVKANIERVSFRAQYIYDALYLPSYQHEKGQFRAVSATTNASIGDRSLVIGRETIRDHILWLAKGTSQDDRAGHAPRNRFVTDDMIDFLTRVIGRYLELLSDPVQIRRKTIEYALEEFRGDPKRSNLWQRMAEAIDSSPIISFGN